MKVVRRDEASAHVDLTHVNIEVITEAEAVCYTIEAYNKLLLNMGLENVVYLQRTFDRAYPCDKIPLA
jgi:hypothetical protein